VDGDNTEANFDYVNQGVCGARSDRAGLWYEIIGNGKNVTVYVCTNNEKITSFGVFETCNTQLCVGGPAQQTEPANCDEGDAHIFEFEAALGEDYFVHVRADVDIQEGGSNFTIWYTEPTEEPTMSPSSSWTLSTSWSVVATAAVTVAGVIGTAFIGAWTD
jgi:hypothetical protein